MRERTRGGSQWRARIFHSIKPVSYTHLDVYKRQICYVLCLVSKRHFVEYAKSVLGKHAHQNVLLQNLCTSLEFFKSLVSSCCIYNIQNIIL